MRCLAVSPVALVLFLGVAGLSACGPAPTPACAQPANQPLDPSMVPARVGLAVGTQRTVRLVTVWPACGDLDVPLVVDDPTLVTVPASVRLSAGTDEVDVDLAGTRVGSTVVHATVSGASVALPVDVVDPTPLPCAGTSAGTLAPGATIAADAATTSAALAGASIALPTAATEVTPFDVTIGCAPDQVPSGWVALGPAVSFAPLERRLPREIPFEIPLRTALLPPQARPANIAVAYTSTSLSTPRLVPVANILPKGTPAQGTLRFWGTRLGTYQAVVRSNAGARRSVRHYVYRGITGVSMGGGGSALIGMQHPELFDFVAPLGGMEDWIYILHQMETWHLGGFCTAQSGMLGSPAGCPVPPADQLFEHNQDFEHWYYDPMMGGQGGTFDRQEYVQIFRDLTYIFENANHYNDASLVTPPGVPDSDRMRSDFARCQAPVQLSNFYDDEYNPDGSQSVIAFCDGNSDSYHVGWFDPLRPETEPMEVALAVDLNRNLVRDQGEPVIRDGHEPYRDVGLDGLADTAEAGYDPVTNPDPAGDDFDYCYNPTGLEKNWMFDSGEPYDDVGLDGLPGTPQLGAGGYDWGEGNGRFDYAPGATNFIAMSPRTLLSNLSSADYGRVQVWTDGGIRDLFNLGVDADQFLAGFASHGGDPPRVYDGFASLMGLETGVDSDFQAPVIRFDDLGRNVALRYGTYDATLDLLQRGDGGHVGTPEQIVDRIMSAVNFMSDNWPGGDRSIIGQSLTMGGMCESTYVCTFDFTSPRTGRTGPLSIALPPGYHEPGYVGVRYPVVYFLHGYGMDPVGLSALALLVNGQMVSRTIPDSQRLQKFILVFPDGHCHPPDDCINGDFFADSVRPTGVQGETYVLDVLDFVDAMFRTRAPEDVEVFE